MPSDDSSRAAEEAERYYDSEAADEFYREVWGGEDIHIGIYEPVDRPIAEASRATVLRMASKLEGLGSRARVIDIGAGYGGSARYLDIMAYLAKGR
jgi:cyclopropane fatty-acyl-phospholipid synthase-like methyltransferase